VWSNREFLLTLRRMVADLDRQRTRTFTQRVIDLLNSAAQALFISLGYRFR